jgi:tRNA pseudouridine55 synthase
MCVDLRACNGVLIVNKPTGMSSGYACRKVGRHFGLKKTGHLGTLDPLATGVLPLCINDGTRVAQYLMHVDKEYVATMRLGSTTDTQDSQGQELSRTDVLPDSPETIRQVCVRFQGEQLQMPPMYSALKRNGQPLYKMARRGETVERKQRAITVFELEVVAIELPDVTLRVCCSGGTYIRTLCHDIGQVLGCGAHVSALQRTRCGYFEIDAALPLEKALELEANMVPQQSFVAMREALQDMPEIMLSNELERKVCNGVSLSGPELPALCRETFPPGAMVKLIAQDGRLISIGSSTCSDGNDAILRPVRVFAH